MLNHKHWFDVASKPLPLGPPYLPSLLMSYALLYRYQQVPRVLLPTLTMAQPKGDIFGSTSGVRSLIYDKQLTTQPS
jgi:hypothetical protein